MILLWGVPGDAPLLAVYEALCRSTEAVMLIDQRSVLDMEIELIVGSSIEGKLRTQTQLLDLCSVTAAYLRPYSTVQMSCVKSVGKYSPAWYHAVTIDDALWSWTELTSALIVNLPGAMATNNSKPYQSSIIQSFGFDIPDTLVTTDSNAALEFWEQHGTIIYKSVSGVRSIVSRLTTEQAKHLEDIRWCPTQFQEYVPGHDYRVHVVGDEIFACEISSKADDYRYASRQGTSVDVHPYDLPTEVITRCGKLARALHLIVAGIDLRRSPDGRWYCFEVNPSPAFTYFQNATGHLIDEAIAQLLLRGSGLSLTPHRIRGDDYELY